MWWNQYINCPFESKGRTPAGFDCWGLVCWIYRYEHPQQIELPSYVDLYRNTRDVISIEPLMNEKKATEWREVNNPQEFDVILLRMRGAPMHVGIVTRPAQRKMIHCSRDVNTTHEKYTSIRHRNKVLGFYRYECK